MFPENPHLNLNRTINVTGNLDEDFEEENRQRKV